MKIYEEYSDELYELIKQHGEANIFYTKEYSEYSKRIGAKCIYVCDDYAMIVVVIHKKFVFKYAEFPSEPIYFTDYRESLFLDNVITVLRKRVHWIMPTGTTANFKGYPENSIRIPFGNYISDLSVGEEELFRVVTSKCRNMIRRAEKDGVRIISGNKELLDKYLICDAATWERSSIALDLKKVYLNYLDTLKENAVIYIAEKDDIVQGGALFIKNKQMSYYMYGASINHPSPGALNLLQWTAMVDFSREGVKKHNMVGCRINVDKDSKYYGIQTFKKSFGGELVEGYMFKSILNKSMYKLFEILYRVKNRGKARRKDIIEQELHKWKDIN